MVHASKAVLGVFVWCRSPPPLRPLPRPRPRRVEKLACSRKRAACIGAQGAAEDRQSWNRKEGSVVGKVEAVERPFGASAPTSFAPALSLVLPLHLHCQCCQWLYDCTFDGVERAQPAASPGQRTEGGLGLEKKTEWPLLLSVKDGQ